MARNGLFVQTVTKKLPFAVGNSFLKYIFFNMKLYTLLHGKSKKKMKPIMIDSLKACENYKNARENSGVEGWHDIQPAPPDSEVWRKKNCTIKGGGDNRNSGPMVHGKGLSGHLGKNGFKLLLLNVLFH